MHFTFIAGRFNKISDPTHLVSQPITPALLPHGSTLPNSLASPNPLKSQCPSVFIHLQMEQLLAQFLNIGIFVP